MKALSMFPPVRAHNIEVVLEELVDRREEAIDDRVRPQSRGAGVDAWLVTAPSRLSPPQIALVVRCVGTFSPSRFEGTKRGVNTGP